MLRTTIKDIAAAVGVSHTTVSYVLNGNTNQKISEKTRNAVLKAAMELGYYPNKTARSLRNDSTKCIAVALEKSLLHNRFNGILQGIREELATEGYDLLLMDFHTKQNKTYPEYISSVLERRADGIIYISSSGDSPEENYCNCIENYNLPFVGCDCCPEQENLASVSFDYEKGAFDVACRLFGEGAKKILYWQPDIETFQEQYRVDGLKKALELYPEKSLEICKMPYLTEKNSSYNRHRHIVFEDICKQSLAQDVLPKIAKFEKGDAVVCSWGVMVKYLFAALYKQKEKEIKIALMSDADIPMLPEMKVLTSRSGFTYGGRESAKLLLSIIRRENIEKRIVIQPEFPTYLSL